MKKILILLLLLTATAGAQVPGPGFAFWKSGAVAPSFSPADIDSLKGWYVASDLADSLGKSDGDTTYILKNRAYWLSPYTVSHLSNLTDAEKPTFRADSSVLVFDGVNDDLEIEQFISYAQPITIIHVARFPKPSPSGFVFFSDGYNGVSNRAAFGNNNTAIGIYAGAWLSGAGAALTADTTYITTLYFNGANSYIRYNGATRIAGNAGTQSMKDFIMGGQFNGTSGHTFSLRETLVYHATLTDEQRGQVESYLATKYGISLP